MYPENKIVKWYRDLPSNVKIAFYSTIVIGLICHVFMMTNKWLNLDDIVQLVDTMERTTSGRWFLTFPAYLGSEFSLPWLNGLLTILYSAIMSSTIVSMFKLHSKISSILIGGILVTFPTIGSLMPFMNTQDAYQFGAMLSCFAAYLLVKKPSRFIWASILLTLSLAIYQTYLGFSAGLILIYALLELFKNDKDIRETISLLAKTALSFFAAIVMYLIVSRGIFGHLLVDYKGLDSMGSIPLSKIPEAVFGAYKAMFLFFTGQEFDYHWPFMPYLFILAIGLIAYLIYYVIKKQKLDKNKIYLVLLILAVFPAVVNIIYIMSWEAGVMLRMAYAYTVCFILPLLLLEFIQYNRIEEKDDTKMNLNTMMKESWSKKDEKLSLVKVASWILVITIFLSVYNNVYVTNKTYFKVWITNKTSDAYANRIAMRLEMVEGYTRETPIMMLGNPDSRTSFTNEIDTDDTKPFVIANHLTRLYSFKYYPKRFLGLPNTIYDESEITPELEPYRERFEEMPLYPAEGSMQLIDGTIYIKFKDIE